MPVFSRSEQVVAPSVPVNEFEDCPATWQSQANAALVTARSWVSNVINGLSHLPSPIPAPVTTLLNKHFHTTFSGDISKIVGKYAEINRALNASIDFECETSCDDNVVAYVYSIWTDVHLCPGWFASSADKKAETIIHELGHDAAGLDDEAYVWQAAYSKLSVTDAMDNADSYSAFAMDAN